MIRHLRHSDIDKAWWDLQLLQCSNRMWYAQSWVLDRANPGWEALVDEGSGAIMPLPWRRKWGIDYLFQPYGLQQLGVFAPEMSDELATGFLHAVPDRFKYWDIQLNEAMCVATSPKAHSEERVQQTLELSADRFALKASYSEGHRRNLRKADGLSAEWETIPLHVDEFVAMFKRTTAARFGGLARQDEVVLADLLHGALEQGQGALVGFRSNGSVLVAQCVLRFHGRIILFKSVVTDKGLEVRAMFHLIDNLIVANAGTGELLDFAGSNTSSVARFNAGFGARTTVYLRLVRNNLPPPLRWLKR